MATFWQQRTFQFEVAVKIMQGRVERMVYTRTE